MSDNVSASGPGDRLAAGRPRTSPAPASTGNLWSDARRQLLHSPVFLVALFIVLVVVSWRSSPPVDRTPSPDRCVLTENRQPPGDGHIFGTTVLGCDMYTHVDLRGPRPRSSSRCSSRRRSRSSGRGSGILSGFYGGWTDTLISRFTDIILGLPFILGALVFLACCRARASGR